MTQNTLGTATRPRDVFHELLLNLDTNSNGPTGPRSFFLQKYNSFAAMDVLWDRLGIRRNAFTEGAVQLWNGLPRDVAESPPAEAFKTHVAVELHSVVYGGLVSTRLKVGLGDRRDLFHPE